MNSMLVLPAALAAARCTAPAHASSDTGAAIVAAATLLLPDLERGRAIDAQMLRNAMTIAFGSSDAEGGWNWKTAYDVCEAVQILFLRKFGPAMRKRAASASAFVAMLEKLAALVPSHTRRSEESQALQQFSTPIELGFVASLAAAITSDDLVLEPSAGTGLLAIHAELAGAQLHLNELADARACLLDQLFGGIGVTRYDAAHIHDHLEEDIRPTVVLMNPPFSVAAHVDGRVADAALRHVSSALARLADGGRLVAITGASVSPDNPTWRDSFVSLQECARLVFSAAIDRQVYARHGTTTETRLTVIDRVPADDPTSFPASPGMASDAGLLLDWVTALVPPRPAVTAAAVKSTTQRIAARRNPAQRILTSRTTPSAAAAEPDAVELTYETIDWVPQSDGRITDALYEEYALQSIRIPGAQPHPTRLVQSAAMASVAPPKPGYRPHLPAAVITDGPLSDAQLESVIYAGDAHGGYLAGAWTVDETFDVVSAASDGRLWVDRLTEGLADTGETLSAADGERIVRLVAHHVGAEVHPASPRLSAELPETGERFEGLIPPVVTAPAFAIRKPAVAVFTLDDYVAAKIVTANQAAALRSAVAQRQNILVAGGTSTGKTTLVNALLAEVAKTADRVVLIEDTRELQCKAPNLVALRTKDGIVSLSDLVRSSLRLRPDRIPIGEVRGAEALDLLKAWGTGHPGGIGTIHAGSALGALRRLEQLIQEAVVTVPRALIAETVNVIAVLSGRGAKRRLAELACIDGLGPAGDYVLAPATHLTSAGVRT